MVTDCLFEIKQGYFLNTQYFLAFKRDMKEKERQTENKKTRKTEG